MEDLVRVQINEITEYHIYSKLAKKERDPEKQKILSSIAAQEKKHFEILAKITGLKPQPRKSKIILYTVLSALFGYHFSLKHMERGEEDAQQIYEKIGKKYPELLKIARDEREHEIQLIELINEERLEYISSMILGLNDGVVELLGTVAGLTLALKNPKLVATTSLIMGIAACLSMSASEYLSTTAEKEKNPLTAAFYTAVSYLAAVIAVVAPFFFFKSAITAFFFSLLFVFGLISFFNYYISVVKKERFLNRLVQMAGVVIAVSSISFLVGYGLRKYLGLTE